MGFVILFAPAAIGLLVALALSLKTLNPFAKFKPMQAEPQPATVSTARQTVDESAYEGELTNA